MDYKEKINEILKKIGFVENDGKLVNSNGLLEVESSFDESGHWQICVTVRMYGVTDCSLLKALNDNGLIDEKFVAHVFRNTMSNYESMV